MMHPGTANVALFVLASLALAITPGPAVIYLVTHTLAEGRRAGFASVAVLIAGALGPKIVGLRSRQSWGRHITAITFIALGLFVALSDLRAR
jgi:threonine/homoserine/homoserine lactone efflux protein